MKKFIGKMKDTLSFKNNSMELKTPYYIERMRELAVENSYQEFIEIGSDAKDLISLFSDNVDFHALYIKSVFEGYKYYTTIEELDKDNLSFDEFLIFNHKKVFEDKGAVLLFDQKRNKKVLGLFIPTFYVTEEYDEVVFIGTSIYNYIVGKGKKLIFSDNENVNFENILQTMENENIDDLHIGMIDGYRYFVSARINQMITPLQDKPLLQSAFQDLYREALKMIGQDDEDVPEIRGMISRKIIHNNGNTINRTYRFASMRVDKAQDIGRSISVRRLKNKEEILRLGLKGLGFDERATAMLLSSAEMDSGLILVTGKTNSGKSTLLATLLGELNRRIITIENPVEIVMDRPNYQQIDLTATENAMDKFKVTIETAVKASLRQDPDVIVIGEVRDAKEDKLFLDLGVKGHLALTTMHTDDVLSTLLRLSKNTDDINEVKANLRLIISTKLIPKKCQVCFGVENVKCAKCKNTGISGILPLFEIAKFDKLGIEDDVFDIKALILSKKVDFYSKIGLANRYKEENLISDLEYRKAINEARF